MKNVDLLREEISKRGYGCVVNQREKKRLSVTWEDKDGCISTHGLNKYVFNTTNPEIIANFLIREIKMLRITKQYIGEISIVVEYSPAQALDNQLELYCALIPNNIDSIY